ncbi:hypothetical protein Ahia01_000388800 [Argonauta hians]
MWAAYNGIEFIADCNYIHQAVNHKRYFVDPVTGVHTNGVEGMWSNAKRKIKSMNGMRRSLINEYMAVFMFRQEFPENVLVHLWKTISELYQIIMVKPAGGPKAKLNKDWDED